MQVAHFQISEVVFKPFSPWLLPGALKIKIPTVGEGLGISPCKILLDGSNTQPGRELLSEGINFGLRKPDYNHSYLTQLCDFELMIKSPWASTVSSVI